MQTVNFPKEKRNTPDEFQSVYEKNWRANTLRAAFTGLVAFLAAFALVRFFGPVVAPEIDAVATWKLLALSGVVGFGFFFAFYESRPKKDEGEITRRVADLMDRRKCFNPDEYHKL